MQKNTFNTNHSRYLTLALITSVIMALWVLYLAIKSQIPSFAKGWLIVTEGSDPTTNTWIWAALFFALALLIALSFIAITFMLTRTMLDRVEV